MSILTRDQVLRAVHDCQLRAPDGAAHTSELAARLFVKKPSVTARVQELAAAGLVRYAPRQGAMLTEEGERKACESLRKLKQIEEFLEAVLGLHRDVCEIEAEHLLRHVSDVVMDAIAQQVRSIRT